jgi:hypothetical protein
MVPETSETTYHADEVEYESEGFRISAQLFLLMVLVYLIKNKNFLLESHVET